MYRVPPIGSLARAKEFSMMINVLNKLTLMEWFRSKKGLSAVIRVNAIHYREFELIVRDDWFLGSHLFARKIDNSSRYLT
jgi:hypothetical protein